MAAMIIKDKSKIIANVKIELRDKNNKIKDIVKCHNTITVLGKNAAASQLLSTPTIVKPGYMELGISNGGSVLLDQYIENSRIPFSYSNASGNKFIMLGYWTSNVLTTTITEAGVFNSAEGNTPQMLLYTTFRGINKQTSDTLLITWIWEIN